MECSIPPAGSSFDRPYFRPSSGSAFCPVMRAKVIESRSVGIKEGGPSSFNAVTTNAYVIDGWRVQIKGVLLRTARLSSEWYEFIDEPGRFIDRLRTAACRADLLTFLQPLSEPKPKYGYYCELDKAAVLPISTYDNWWKTQINDKTRNMVRRAGKKGVTLQVSELNDEFLRGIKTVYDECPIRQGKPFKHYGKDLETIRREHSAFLERSEIIGAYAEGELIGFVKVVYQGAWASLMNIIAKISEREKSPTNALIAKAVERCADRGIGLLHYGIWSRQGMGDFKMHHGFQCYEVPRYYVPLSARGRQGLRWGMHKGFGGHLPESWLDVFTRGRTRWYNFRYRKHFK